MSDGKKIPCSVPILTLNSEEYLERCLKSVSEFADVYIADGNSTDRTKEIAASYGVPVYKQVESDEPNIKIDNFTEARNRAYARAKESWLLILDSDEYVTPELVNEIRVTLEKNADRKIGYNIKNRLVFNGRAAEYCFSYPNNRTKLYHLESGIGYIKNKAVHESITIPDGVETVDLEHYIHSSATQSYGEGVKKDNEYLAIVKKKFFHNKPRVKGELRGILKSIISNLFQGGSILAYSLLIYLKHGYKRSAPFHFTLRHVRYHAILSYYRILQLFHYFFVRK